jgi:hypothetical protein
VNVNDYMDRVYPSPPCWDLVADVYLSEMARAVTKFRIVNNSVRSLAAVFRIAIQKNPDGFAQLAGPEEMCLVLLAATPSVGTHHCGVYVDGKVLHALESGVVYQDMASLGDAYQVIEFWGLAP